MDDDEAVPPDTDVSRMGETGPVASKNDVRLARLIEWALLKLAQFELWIDWKISAAESWLKARLDLVDPVKRYDVSRADFLAAPDKWAQLAGPRAYVYVRGLDGKVAAVFGGSL